MESPADHDTPTINSHHASEPGQPPARLRALPLLVPPPCGSRDPVPPRDRPRGSEGLHEGQGRASSGGQTPPLSGVRCTYVIAGDGGGS